VSGPGATGPAVWRAVWIVARRELTAYFHAPIAYVAGVLFLVLQGFSFWALVSVLADPARPAPLGAVLHQHFGGTFLYWTVLLAYVALLAMRLVAEDRRQGTWETLLTAPVDVEAVLAGKWLGGVGFYLCLWLPTALYPALIAMYAPAPPDPGPILAAYLGVVVTGMAFLAVGLAASAVTSNQIVAAILAFAALMLLLLLGQVRELLPAWLEDHARVSALLAHLDLRGHMDALARGAIALPVLVFHASLAAVGLAAAQLVAVRDRRARRERRRRAVAFGLVVASAISANVLAARHPVTWDVSAGRTSSLEPRTRELLAALDASMDVIVISAGLEAFSEVQDEVDGVLALMVAAQPALSVERVDPALASDRVGALAAELALPVADLAGGGAVIFQQGERRRGVDLLDMAGFEVDLLGAGAVARFRAEEAFATAIAELVNADRPVICHSTGHGELQLAQPDAGGSLVAPGELDAPGAPGVAGVAHWGPVAVRIAREGARIEAVDSLEPGVPEHCRVLVVAGPTRPLSGREAQAVDRYLARGGRLLLALATAIDAAAPESASDAASGPAGGADAGHAVGNARLPATGLELVLAPHGIQMPRAVVVDPAAAVAGPAQWLTTTGHGRHAIASSFRDRRFTLWLAPRAVLAAAPELPGARVDALVQSSADGWAETDLASLALGEPRRDDADLPGPVAVAVAAEAPATGARVVVFGSAASLSSLVVDRGANDLLAVAALAWLGGRTQQLDDLDIGAKTPEQIRLIMSRGQMLQVLVLCVVVLPGALALVGGLSWWRRRRG
jgi:ABC-2 type transport system permease protein